MIKYSQRFQRFAGKDFRSKLNDLKNRTRNLRKHWFQNKTINNMKEIIELLNYAKKIQEKGFTLFNEYLIDNYVKRIENEKFYLADPNYPIVFKKSDNYTKKSEDIFRRTKPLLALDWEIVNCLSTRFRNV